MKSIKILIFSLFFLNLYCLAQPAINLRPDETVLLYSDSFECNIDPIYGSKISYARYKMDESNDIVKKEHISEHGFLENTSDYARMDLYFPEKGNGQMILVCPGGGYGFTSTYGEGLYVAKWMIEQGISVGVLKYRMPNGHHKIPSTDVFNSMIYCREHSEQWGINQIGIMGFSAGGHLAATASTLWENNITRPDFSILIYPVITMESGVTHQGTRNELIGEDTLQADSLADQFSIENRVNMSTPPTFIAVCSDDTIVPVENSIRYYQSLIRNRIKAELHVWPVGDHGWGYSKQEYRNESETDSFQYARDKFESLLKKWLCQILS